MIVETASANLMQWEQQVRASVRTALMDPAFQAWQVGVLHAIQEYRSPFLDKVGVWLSAFGNYSSYLVLASVLLWVCGEAVCATVVWTAVVAMIVTDVLKGWMDTPRPIGIPGVRSDYVQSAAGASFPSGHAIVAMAVYARLGRKLRKLRGLHFGFGLLVGICTLLPYLIGLSRLYLGVHWPVDVVAGWLIGGLLSHLTLRVYVTTSGLQVRHPRLIHALESLLGIVAIGLVLLTLPLVSDTVYVLQVALGFLVCRPLLYGLRPVVSFSSTIRRLSLGLLSALVLIVMVLPPLSVNWLQAVVTGAWICLIGWAIVQLRL